MLLLDEHTGARAVIYATLVAGFAGEGIATYRGRGSVRRSGGSPLDRGTKQVVVLAMVAGFFAGALVAAHVPALRAGANTWATFGLGLGVLWLGIGLRLW